MNFKSNYMLKLSLLFLCSTVLFAQSSNSVLKKFTNWLSIERNNRPAPESQKYFFVSLNKSNVKEVLSLIKREHTVFMKEKYSSDWKAKSFTTGKYTMKFDYKIFGDKPVGGRSLFISMHGGGAAEKSVNDQQWENQIDLYQPAEGVYLAPRAPTDEWNLWHLPHIDKLFNLIIQAASVFENVNLNKVYILGYSAGGDGVYQLATRMADRWAAASMMAGHPNETTPDNLRNIGFSIWVGELDSGYGRNKEAEKWKGLLNELQQKDSKGYIHEVHIVSGKAHWMDRVDKAAVPWMTKFTRNPFPDKIVWKQDDVHHSRFYWLSVPKSEIQTGSVAIVSHLGNKFRIEAFDGNKLTILLNDKIADLDKPIEVFYKGKRIFNKPVVRTLNNIWNSYKDYEDEYLTFCSKITLENIQGNKISTKSGNKNSLKMKEYLIPGNKLTSNNGFYKLIYQEDGNLVIYNKSGSASWSTNTWGNPAWRVYFQDDGNLVVYKRNGKPVWASNTFFENCKLILQNDGNLVIYDMTNKKVLWSNK